MNVLEALVINATGWRDGQEKQWKEAEAIIYAARHEINRQLQAKEPPAVIEWVPKP